jgi:hypothetical protein
MKTLFDQHTYKNTIGRTLLPLECYACGKSFNKRKSDIVRSSHLNAKNKAMFCSIKCQIKYQHPKIKLSCMQCQAEIYKTLSQSRASQNHFCSQSCAATYNNTHKSKGTRRSKLEKWIEQELPCLFPQIRFEFNTKSAIGSELDIYLPDLKLAFELNGIFHYEPIYGPEKLSQIKNNDMRKYQACIEHKIELCIIDASAQKYFKTKTARKYLDIIQNIIALKLSIASPTS